RRTAALLTRYWPSPPRWRRRVIAISLKSSSENCPSALSNRSSTSHQSAAARPAAPANRTSSGFSARSSEGDSEPEAQSSASETFDFPDPFGPTTTATPRSRRTSTGSGNDLKPRILIARRCTRGSVCRLKRTPLDRLERFARCGLLGILLRAAGARAQLLAVDHRSACELP